MLLHQLSLRMVVKMNEQQFNAIRESEYSAARLVARNGLAKPKFMFPGGDMSIEFRKAVEAIQVFLAELADAEPKPAKPVEPEPVKPAATRRKASR